MSALARYFNTIGKKVIGYDKTGTRITDALQKEGISIGFKDDVDSSFWGGFIPMHGLN